ncbi:hypothetical protein FSARC_7047 [Fusarium sarcochroum]|uniref:F-box domain-containing protein n=1 Tax=Fusarium sarcochroum TaxID=1208366 RepID=A0A8H4TW73_9HYPO|nr:hypothetical protein FSARC_7047 [Fusarium sarcochroum]
MGSFHTYCAICGGTLNGAEIKDQMDSDENEEKCYGSDGTDSDEDEDGYYNPNVISQDDLEWTMRVHVLGFNLSASNVSKFAPPTPVKFFVRPRLIVCRFYISGSGWADGFGGVDVEEGNDPTFQYAGRYATMYGETEGPERIFPFHWPCYETLSRYMTGTPDTSKLDKGALYRAFNRINDAYRSLDLDYGDAGQFQEQFWESEPGMEYLVVNTRYQPELKSQVLDFINSERFKSKPLPQTIQAQSKIDVLASIPEAVMFEFMDLLDNDSLINLCHASWSTFLRLRDHRFFWKRRIMNCMTYFVELQEAIEDGSHSEEARDFRKIFLWADTASKPRSGITGFMLPIANRRRIWDVCEQIEKLYSREYRKRHTPRIEI